VSLISFSSTVKEALYRRFSLHPQHPSEISPDPDRAQALFSATSASRLSLTPLRRMQWVSGPIKLIIWSEENDEEAGHWEFSNATAQCRSKVGRDFHLHGSSELKFL